jgi:host factor-I protein
MSMIRTQAVLRKNKMEATQEKDRQMENKPAQNIQDSFLNTARKDKIQITIYLLSGVKLSGRIRSFDKYSVVLETNNQEQLIFKHAISTVVMSKGGHHGGDHRSHYPANAESEAGSVKSEG